MNARRITRWVVVAIALCAGFSVAGRDTTHLDAAPNAAPGTNPLAAETLPIPAPESGTGQRAEMR